MLGIKLKKTARKSDRPVFISVLRKEKDMSDDGIAAFVQRIQDEMKTDARERYGEKFYQRWQQPKYMDAMADPDVISLLKGPCGDSMMLFLKFKNGIVEQATFKTDGCALSIVCGSYAAELSLGKNPQALMRITGETIMRQFGQLPEQQRHCAFHAAATIHKAADKYMAEQAAENRKTNDRAAGRAMFQGSK